MLFRSSIQKQGGQNVNPEPSPINVYSGNLFLVGDNTPGQWRLWEATPLLRVGSSDIFSATLYLTASGSFKIATDRDGDYSQKFFFRDANDYGRVSEDGTGDRQWSVGSDANYTVSVNMQNMTISIRTADQSNARGFSGADEFTSINNVETSYVDDDVYYTLQGVRVSNPDKGVYVIKGKKVIVK